MQSGQLALAEGQRGVQGTLTASVERMTDNLTTQAQAVSTRVGCGFEGAARDAGAIREQVQAVHANLQRAVGEVDVRLQVAAKETEIQAERRASFAALELGKLRELVVAESDKTRQLAQQIDRDNLNRRMAELHAENLDLRRLQAIR